MKLPPERQAALQQAQSAYMSTILPIIKYKEDPRQHAAYIVENNPQVKFFIENDQRLYPVLEHIAIQTYKNDYRTLFVGAKLADSWDRVLTAGELILEATMPGAGVALTHLGEWADFIAKAAFNAYFIKKTEDYAGGAGFLFVEALSMFIPGVGPILNLPNMYVWRTTEVYQNKVAQEFLDYARTVNVVDAQSMQAQGARQNATTAKSSIRLLPSIKETRPAPGQEQTLEAIIEQNGPTIDTTGNPPTDSDQDTPYDKQQERQSEKRSEGPSPPLTERKVQRAPAKDGGIIDLPLHRR